MQLQLHSHLESLNWFELESQSLFQPQTTASQSSLIWTYVCVLNGSHVALEVNYMLRLGMHQSNTDIGPILTQVAVN